MSTRLPEMSLEREMTSGYNWQELDESNYKPYQLEFVKRFKINDVIGFEPEASIDKDIREVIKGNGFGRLALLVDFEIELDDEKYILSTEVTDKNNKNYVDANVHFIYETPESERLVNDIVRRLYLSQEDAENLRTHFYSEFPQFYDLFDEHKIYRSLNALLNENDLIDEMGIVTDKDVFDTLRKRVQACALKDYGVDLEAIEKEEKEASDLQSTRKVNRENRDTGVSFPSF